MDTRIAPAFLLRKYIWEVLKVNTDMAEADYGNLVPIVPVAEEPEITEYDKPYIVYGFASHPAEPGNHFKKRGSMTFVVYSTKFNEITDILNILETTFEREDEAARDVNAFTSRTPGFVGLRFGTISLGFNEGPAPEEQEGGRQSGLLNIRFEYYVDYNVVTSV